MLWVWGWGFVRGGAGGGTMERRKCGRVRMRGMTGTRLRRKEEEARRGGRVEWPDEVLVYRGG